jgi:hypothetical protein
MSDDNAKSVVTFSVEGIELGQGSRSMDFEVRDGFQKIGTLRISRGAIYWKAANKQKSRRFTWTAFADQLAK